jgi:VWFA-related protein
MSRSSSALLAAVVAAGAAVFAQQPPPQQFRSTTDLVLLDVSVLDKQRKAVHGLKAEDFTILEDGQPQTIATFSAVEVPNPEAPTAKWMSRTPRDVQTNRMPNGRMVLLYIDERQPSQDPFASKATIDVSHAIIDQLSPDDVMAVGFVLDHRGAQEFTTDRGRLHAAVDAYSPAQPVGISVLGTLRDLASLLGAIPERRKILIYVGPGQGYDQEVLTTMEKVTATGSSPGAFGRVDQQTMYDNLLSLFRVAQRANVSIYTVDPSGLTGTSPSSPSKDFLRIVASNTGARAVIGNNQPASQVPIMMAENAAYYLIAYRSTNQRTEGKFRKLDVKIDRPGVEVRTRRGYVEGRTAGPQAMGGTNPALSRLIPATQLALGLWAVPVASDAAGSHPVAMMVNVTLPREAAPPTEHIAVSYSIVDMSGKEQASGRRDVTVHPPSGADATYVAQVSALANLPPGRYDIRLSAQSLERNRRGGLLGDVIVPDFAKEALSLSGLFVGSPSAADARGDEVAVAVGLAPTTDRWFATTDAVATMVRIYQAKQPLQPVTVKATILDAHDKPAFEAIEKLPAEAFGAGPATYRFALPLAKLTPGAYMLRLEASRPGAQAVKRETMFDVR